MVHSAKLDSEERRILRFASVSHFLTHFYMLVFPALVMPLSRELGLSVASVLNLSFWMYLLYGLLALLWGWISDHWGHRWALSAGILMAGIGFTGVGLFSTPVALSICFAIVGVGCSSYHPAGTALVSQGIRVRGRALGILGIWGNVGTAAAPFAVGLLNYLIGWRTGVVTLGIVGICVGLFALFTPFTVRRGEDRKKVGEMKRNVAGRLFFLFCIGLIFTGLSYRAFTLLLPAFLEARLGSLIESLRRLFLARLATLEDIGAFDTFTATVAATGIYLLGIAGQVLGGRIADRFSLKRSYLIFFVVSLPFVVGMALLPGLLLVLSAGIFVFFTHGMQPIENSLIAYLTPARWRSVSYGIKFTLAFTIGSFAVRMVSAVENSYGLSNAIWLVAVLVVLVIANTLVFLWLSRKYDIRH